ncbi:MAG: cytochrome c [Gammaproteobacteria bacterium]|nr:cytochrome c [Gammaproteobacteria bacterium]MCY4340897.1 cytochrome c [Gammaproteobacteria bacterium]
MKRMFLGVLALAAGGLALGGADADEGLSGVAKERHELMEGLAGAIKPMADMVRSIQPYDADRMRELAKKIAGSGGETMTSLFPEGSYDPAGEALPAIWEDWDRFVMLAGKMVDAANAMAAAADNPPGPPSAGAPDSGAGGGDPQAMDAGMALIQLGMSCGACHDDFRKEDDH